MSSQSSGHLPVQQETCLLQKVARLLLLRECAGPVRCTRSTQCARRSSPSSEEEINGAAPRGERERERCRRQTQMQIVESERSKEVRKFEGAMGRTRMAERANSEKLCDSSVNREKLGSPSKNCEEKFAACCGPLVKAFKLQLGLLLLRPMTRTEIENGTGSISRLKPGNS